MSKVLVIRISSFGDVAMLVPVIYSVATKYPQDKFSILTRKAFAPLFENLGFNVSVIPFDINKKHKGIRGLFKLTGKLASSGFSHVADEHDVLRSKFIRTSMRLLGCKVAKIDKGRKDKNAAIYTKKIEPPLTPTIDRYMAVFAQLGFSSKMIFTNILNFSHRDLDILKPIVGEKTNKWIGIAPFAKHRGKIYPSEKMEKIVEKLSEDKNITVLLFGAGTQEQAVIAKWADKYRNVKDIAGKLKLENELLLISQLDVMLSMDSANMHLASLVETPVVSIWGATHPNLGFYGFAQNIDNAIQIEQEKLSCRPCSVYGDIPCQRGDYACLQWISEDTIVEKLYAVLAQVDSK